MKRRTLLSVPLAVAANVPLQRLATAAVCTGPGLGRGFHLGEATGRTLNDFRQMAAAGANLVRFGIALVPDATGKRYAMAPTAMPELIAQLGFARATGLRLILVLRPEPEPQSALWHDPSLQDSLIEHWAVLSRKLSGHADVAAFDLLNESHPPGPSFADKEQVLVELSTRLIRAVRAVDSSRTIVYEPSPGARPMAFSTAGKLPFDNVVYSVHMYEPFDFTHQGTGDWRAAVEYPGQVPGQRLWNRDRLIASLAPVKQFADMHGVEIYVGEFGSTRWAPDASRERYLQDLVSIFDEWHWSWTYHAWQEWHGWDAQMNRDPASRERRESEPAFQVIRQALLRCGTVGGKR